MEIVRLPIVTVKHTKFYKWGVCLSIIGILMLYYSIFFRITNDTLRIVVGILTMSFIFIIPIIINIRRTIINEYIEIGELIINERLVNIIINEKKDEYKLSELKNIKLNYTNAADVTISRWGRLSDGISNYFSFDHKETHYKFRVYIKNYTWLRIIDDFVHNNQIDIELYKSGKKVNKLMTKL